MLNFFLSFISVAFRTLPNLVLFVCLAQYFEILEVGTALFGITICTLLASVVDYGLSDRFNYACANEKLKIKNHLSYFMSIRFRNFFFLYTFLLLSKPLFPNTELYLYCVTYFPISSIFLFQNLLISAIRYKFDFQLERKIQQKISFINILLIILIPLIFELEIYHYFLILFVGRLLIFLIYLYLYRFHNILKSIFFEIPISKHLKAVKENFGWSMAHVFGVLALNIDLLVLIYFLSDIDFSIYQIIIRFFISLTLLSTASNAVILKDISSIDDVSIRQKNIYKILFKVFVLYFVISSVLFIATPLITNFVLNVPQEFMSNEIYVYLCLQRNQSNYFCAIDAY